MIRSKGKIELGRRLNMKEKTLYYKLNKYSKEDYYPFHMPGHKRSITDSRKENEKEKCQNDICRRGNEYDELEDIRSLSPYMYDITEIDGFDNLHKPEGIIKERLELARRFYGSKKSYFLVNGSTCGILAAISAVCGREKKLVMARNSHKAAYNSVFINNMEAVYIYPETVDEMQVCGGVDAENIEKILVESDNIGAVYITSPTYEGIVSDVEKISSICHKYEIPLIVDEAHGAHFGISKEFPKSALELGADIVIQSLHKTLPALTQTAILHISENSIIDNEEIERYLSIYQTSSPSYVLMASIDKCLEELIRDKNTAFEALYERITKFKEKCRKLSNFKFLDNDVVGKYAVKDFDLSKLVIFVENEEYSGQELYDELLLKYHLQMEMSSLNYVIAMTSIMDRDEGFDRLYEALYEIDDRLELGKKNKEKGIIKEKRTKNMYCKNVAVTSIYRAVNSKKEDIEIDKCLGRIAGEFIYMYPPGIPVIAPGEVFSEELLEAIKVFKRQGHNIIGFSSENTVKVLTREVE